MQSSQVATWDGMAIKIPALLDAPGWLETELARPPFHPCLKAQDFEIMLQRASVALIALAPPEDSGRPCISVDLVRRLKAGHPAVTLVVVTALHPTSVRTALAARPAEVICWPAERESLSATMSRLAQRSPKVILTAMTEAAGDMPLGPRVAIRCMCDVNRPVVTRVEDLAACTGISTSKLRSDFRILWPTTRLKEIVDHLVWLRAIQVSDSWPTATSTLRVALRLGVHESTLERLSRRVTGVGFGRSRVEPVRSVAIEGLCGMWRSNSVHHWPAVP